MLLVLPSEVVALIVELLDPPSILSVRLVCRQLNETASPIAAKHFFETIETDVTRESLTKLQRLASCEVYRLAVRTIQFRAERYGKGSHWPHDADGFVECDSYNAIALQIILSQFDNCECITIDTDHLEPLDKTSDRYLKLVDALSLVFCLITKTAKPIRHISLFWIFSTSETRLRYVAPASLKGDKFGHRWAQLQSLDLKLRLDDHMGDIGLLTNLFSRAKALTRFQFQQDNGRGEQRLFETLHQTDSLPNLTHLTLCGVYEVRAPDLIKFFGRFRRSLKNLRLDWIFVSGSWGQTFSSLQQGFRSLRFISLVNLYRINPSKPAVRAGNRLFFCPIRTEIQNRKLTCFELFETTDQIDHRRFCIAGVRYQGESADCALSLIQKSMYWEGSPPEGSREFVPEPPRQFSLSFKPLSDKEWPYNNYT